MFLRRNEALGNEKQKQRKEERRNKKTRISLNELILMPLIRIILRLKTRSQSLTRKIGSNRHFFPRFVFLSLTLLPNIKIACGGVCFFIIIYNSIKRFPCYHFEFLANFYLFIEMKHRTWARRLSSSLTHTHARARKTPHLQCTK